MSGALLENRIKVLMMGIVYGFLARWTLATNGCGRGRQRGAFELLREDEMYRLLIGGADLEET